MGRRVGGGRSGRDLKDVSEPWYQVERGHVTVEPFPFMEQSVTKILPNICHAKGNEEL